MRIDSIHTIGSDIIYYPYRSQRIKNYLGGGTATVDTLGASWLGKKVIKHLGGVFVFDNMWDSIFIKTQAHTGDSWMFFNDTSVFSYIATLTAEDTMTISGTLDSIKTITITADSGGFAYPLDPVNNFQIILSKNHGFVQVFDLYTFPYHRPDSMFFNPHGGIYYIRHFDYYLDVLLGNLGTCDLGCISDVPPDTINSVFHLFPFHDPTLMEIYDFTIGDIYETKFSVGGGGPYTEIYTLDSITAKTLTAYNVAYGGTEHKMKWDFPSPGPPVITYPTAFFSVPGGDTSLLIPSQKMPEEWDAGLLLHYYPNGFPGSLSCHEVPSYVIDQDFVGGGFGDNGFALMPSYHNTTYSIGFGITGKYDYNAFSYVSQTHSYIYYHKDTISCGTLVLTDRTNIRTVNLNNSIQIIPNPANDYINVSANPPFDNNTLISIYDITGKCVYRSDKELQNLLTINTSTWNSGLYLVIIQNNTGILKKEKITILR